MCRLHTGAIRATVAIFLWKEKKGNPEHSSLPGCVRYGAGARRHEVWFWLRGNRRPDFTDGFRARVFASELSSSYSYVFDIYLSLSLRHWTPNRQAWFSVKRTFKKRRGGQSNRSFLIKQAHKPSFESHKLETQRGSCDFQLSLMIWTFQQGFVNSQSMLLIYDLLIK